MTLIGQQASATANLRTSGPGTEIDLNVNQLPPTRAGELYEVWFVRDDGRVSAGTFIVADGHAHVQLTTAARPGGYLRIGITREPDGTDPARNRPNVLTGQLPS